MRSMGKLLDKEKFVGSSIYLYPFFKQEKMKLRKEKCKRMKEEPKSGFGFILHPLAFILMWWQSHEMKGITCLSSSRSTRLCYPFRIRISRGVSLRAYCSTV